MTAELQGFADYGEVPQPYDEHVHFLRSFEGETVRVHTYPGCIQLKILTDKTTELKRGFLRVILRSRKKRVW